MNFFIRNLGIILCSIFYFMKLLHLQNPKHFLVRVSIFSVLLSIVSIYTEQFFPYITIPTQILCLVLFLKANTKMPLTVSVTTTAIGFVFSSITLFVSTTISAILYHLIIKDAHRALIQLLCCILQLLLMPFPFRLKRLKNGMPFLYKDNYAFPGMLISICALFILTLGSYAVINEMRFLFPIFFLSTCILALLLYHYWRSNLTKIYLDKVNERNLLRLNETIARQDRQMELLKAENERLAKIVHQDNHLIPELAYAVRTYLTSHTLSETDFTSTGERLWEDLSRLTEERKGILHQQDMHCQSIPSTKVFCIDTLLAYMQQTARESDIELQTSISEDIPYLVEEMISEDDLHTLLTYLLDNAIIATRHNKGHYVLLSIGIVSNVYTISVFDSGIPFTMEVLEKWGLQQITTHKEDGGSGIGLLTIYEILKKYNASFIVHELDTDHHSFTKEVTISFNKKHQYILQTSRPEQELESLSKRVELQIIRQ